jgi:phenylacetate-CoA ligase
VYAIVARNVLAPVLDAYRGAGALKCLEELEKTQWWPRDEILSLQRERLKKLLRHAHDSVPYYRQVFEQTGLIPDDIQASEDLARLPVLTKRDIRDNSGALIARGFPKGDLVPLRTGGATGEPLRFCRTKDDVYGSGIAAGLRAYRWAGYEVGDRCALLCEPSARDSRRRRVSRGVVHRLERVTVFNPHEMSQSKLEQFARKLAGFHGGVIKGYPSAIYILARYLETEGRTEIRPKALISVGEALQDSQRDLFSRVFQCECYSYYGSMEAAAIASECPEHAGLHVSAEHVVVEIVDEDGSPVPPGRQGRILVTNLDSYAMPLLRYEIGDLGVASDRQCSCGRGLPLLAAVNGRTADVLYTRDGRPLPGVALPFQFLASLGVEQVQVVQDTYERVVVRLVMAEGSGPSALEKAIKETTAQFKAALGDTMEIAVEIVGEIPATPFGKRRFVISELAKTP